MSNNSRNIVAITLFGVLAIVIMWPSDARKVRMPLANAQEAPSVSTTSSRSNSNVAPTPASPATVTPASTVVDAPSPKAKVTFRSLPKGSGSERLLPASFDFYDYLTPEERLHHLLPMQAIGAILKLLEGSYASTHVLDPVKIGPIYPIHARRAGQAGIRLVGFFFTTDVLAGKKWQPRTCAVLRKGRTDTVQLIKLFVTFPKNRPLVREERQAVVSRLAKSYRDDPAETWSADACAEVFHHGKQDGVLEVDGLVSADVDYDNVTERNGTVVITELWVTKWYPYAEQGEIMYADPKPIWWR